MGHLKIFAAIFETKQVLELQILKSLYDRKL